MSAYDSTRVLCSKGRTWTALVEVCGSGSIPSSIPNFLFGLDRFFFEFLCVNLHGVGIEDPLGVGASGTRCRRAFLSNH